MASQGVTTIYNNINEEIDNRDRRVSSCWLSMPVKLSGE